MKPTLTKTMDMPVSSSSRRRMVNALCETGMGLVLYFWVPVFESSA
jgi:hypothetical protein